MRIGCVRPEEAMVFDQYAGYHQFHAEETQEPFGSYEIFFAGPHDLRDDEGECLASGWYYWSCLPGCLPDGDPIGPFASSRDAMREADEWNPEFDADFAAED